MSAPAITTAKTEHPADGSPRWIVSGDAGQVIFDVLGPHLALLFTDGEIESMGKQCTAHVREYAELGDDEAVFAVLAEHYRTQMAGGAR